MARIKVGVTAHRRHKHILKLAKGYRGAKHLQFKKATAVLKNASSAVCGLPVSMLQPVLTA